MIWCSLVQVYKSLGWTCWGYLHGTRWRQHGPPHCW